MSYLVDALKKAERERHAGQAGDLHRAATAATYGRRGTSGAWRWLIAALVASNVGLVVYALRPQPAGEAASSATAAPAQAQARHNDADTMALAQAALQPRDRVAPESHDAPDAAAMSVTRSAPLSGRNSTSTSGATSAQPASDGDGSVRYSRVPLTGDAAPPAETAAAATAAPDADYSAASDDDSVPMQADVSVPAVRINGQLYSSVPGRSFILVDGRRYHEGERLKAGPAVEQIEPSGAILNFQGQRYRVAGPG
ncbi:general secretion pathway protein GspB [Salinisphaera sp. Q1T1-3]|uniref:general secretion pathway protein GspB n=1 Tax=Salinisphaera sp. Q1T1-3 TaxID=2321229 RepID=UPI0013149697|nr:general secretion pathway protein GspB [Salinisphaera sp. Q1T1-3]